MTVWMEDMVAALGLALFVASVLVLATAGEALL